MPIDQNAAFGTISGLIDFIANDQLRKEDREFQVREEQRRDLREEDQAFRRGGINTVLDLAKSGKLTEESTQGILTKMLSSAQIQGGDIDFRKSPQMNLGPLSSMLAEGSPTPNIDETKGIADVFSEIQLGEQRKTAAELNREKVSLTKEKTKEVTRGKKASGTKADVTLKDAITQAGTRLRNLESNLNADPEQVKTAKNRYDMLIDRMDQQIGIKEKQEKKTGSPRSRINTLKLMRRNNQIDNDNYYDLLRKGLKSGRIKAEEANAEARAVTRKTLGSLGQANPEQYKAGVAELYKILKKFMSREAAQQIIRGEIGIK